MLFPESEGSGNRSNSPVSQSDSGLKGGVAQAPAVTETAGQRLTTGHVTVRVIPSMSWTLLTTKRPRASTDSA